MENIIEITTTLPTESDALEIARSLVEKRLAACVQVSGPTTSVYRWKGDVQQEIEWRCTIKSIATLQDRIMHAISLLHPYETPEILVLPAQAASAPYASWLREQVGEE